MRMICNKRGSTMKHKLLLLLAGLAVPAAVLLSAAPAQAMPWSSSHDGWVRYDGAVTTMDISVVGGTQADGSGKYLDSATVYCGGDPGGWDQPCGIGTKLVIWQFYRDGSYAGSVILDADVPRWDTYGGQRTWGLGDRLRGYNFAAEWVGKANRQDADNKSVDIGKYVG